MINFLTHKLISIILILTVVISMTGCASNPSTVDNLPDSESSLPSDDLPNTSEETQLEPEVAPDDTSNTEQTNETPEDVGAPEEQEVVDEPEDELTRTQLNSIAMLNYLATLSQEINSSKNSRLFLEEAYAALINNTNPEAVNEITESHLSSLLDIIERYRMITVKRDRLQYMYEQGKARAIKAAIPNPVALLSAASSLDMKRLIVSALYMAVDSVASYEAYKEELNQEFLQDGWELDDEEAANLHESRKRAFMYMLDIVREDNLPGNLALNENNVRQFVEWKNKDSETSNVQKIQFFEAEEKTYEAFGNYWLELADCYYFAEDYEKCLECIARYEDLQSTIFRKDYYFAEILPKVIVAASYVYSDDEYVSNAERYLQLLVDNTNNDEWALRYFAAEIYLELYAKTNNMDYLQRAYDIALNNVNYLVGEQRKLNETYINDVKEVSASDTASKEEKKQIKEYNKALHKARETELPPVYQPLIINCDLLFAIADKMNLSKAAQDRVDGVLHQSTTFLTTSLENHYSFNSSTPVNMDATFDKDSIQLPVSCVSENSHIVVTVIDDGKKVYDDWAVKKVDRKDKQFDEYIVTFSSDAIKKHKWSSSSIVTVEIFEGLEADAYLTFTFKVSKFKDYKVYTTVEFEKVS